MAQISKSFYKMFLKVLEDSQGKDQCRNLFSTKLQPETSAYLNVPKFLRPPVFTEHLWLRLQKQPPRGYSI